MTLHATWLAASVAALFALGAASDVVAAPFEIALSPSRLELQSKSGARVGQSLDIQNMSERPAQVAIRTIDWTYSATGDIGFHDDLLPGSCRPWVTLERGTLGIPAHGRKSFRFQIDVPANAARSECRFMISVEGTEPAQQSVMQGGGAALSLPVMGRIAVAVYVLLDGAQPKLELKQVATHVVQGKKQSFVTVTNTGDAHGRIQGSLDAVDNQGRSFELFAEGTPILPAQTRTLALTPQVEPGKAAVPYAYPFKVSGMLDWDRGSFKVETELK